MWAPWRRTPGPAPRTLLASIGADASLRTDRGASAILSPDGATLAFAARQAGQDRALRAQARSAAGGRTRGHRGRRVPVLLPGRPVDRVLRGRQAEEGLGHGRRPAQPVRRAERSRRRLGRRRHHRLRAGIRRQHAADAGLRLRRSAFGSRNLRRGRRDAAVATGAPRRQGPALHRTLGGTDFDAANLVVAPLSGGTPKVVVRGGYYGRYVPSGHLLYMQQGTLFAAAFDLDRLETIGQAVPALEGVAADPGAGGAQVAFSADGTLVYVPGAAAAAAHPIDWMTRDGKVSPLRAERGAMGEPGLFTGRPEAGARHLGRQAARHLGLRVGPGHPDPVDLRLR